MRSLYGSLPVWNAITASKALSGKELYINPNPKDSTACFHLFPQKYADT